MFEIRHKCKSCQGNPIVSHYGSNYSVLYLDMFHASSDRVKSQYERLSSPETEESTKESKMEEKVAYVDQVFFLVGVTECLNLMTMYFDEEKSPVKLLKERVSQS